MISYIDDGLDISPDERLEIFLRICIRQILQFPDSDRFLNWVSENGQYFLPEMAAELDPKAMAPAQLFRKLGRDIWEATPLPHKNFAKERLPIPGRNDLCHCGSGRKFKQCCESWNAAELSMKMDLLPYVLEMLPKKRWAELAGSAVSFDAVAAVAFALLNDGYPEDAIKLLTPWFAEEGQWPKQLAELLDFLLDAYEVLGKRKKRKDLALAATVRGVPQVAAIGWQRLAAMSADDGDLPGAWEAFNQAQRADPDNIALAMLEITMLVSEQKWAQASQRAQFWAARIARMPGPNQVELLDYLNQVVRDPQQAMQQIGVAMRPSFGHLTAMLEAAPAVACAYRLQPQDGSAGPLEPAPALAAAREAWDKAFPAALPFSVQMTTCNAEAWEEAGRWLPLLASQPILWQDFDVLDDLVCAIDGLDTLGLDGVIQALTSRALALLDCVLNDQQANRQQLEWGFMANRPALRLVVRHILDCWDKGNTAEALPWLERMVNELNPHDNHGLRDILMRHYLQNNDFLHAVALGDRYPDDLGAMRYNRALAYYRAGRQAEADDILMDALNEYPLIGKLLLAKRVPKLKDGPMALGSRDEASRYRAEHLSLWPDDALAWLTAARKR